MLLEQFRRQPQSIGVASNFAVHQIPSIWSAPNLTSARAATAVYGGTGAAVGAPSGGALGAIGNHPATTTAILIWRKLCRMRTKCAKVLARAAIVPEINEHYAATRIGASGWSFGCTVNG